MSFLRIEMDTKHTMKFYSLMFFQILIFCNFLSKSFSVVRMVENQITHKIFKIQCNNASEVLQPIYGKFFSRSKSVDVTQIMNNLCRGNNACQFKVNSAYLPDPHHGVQKTLTVHYTCIRKLFSYQL